MKRIIILLFPIIVLNSCGGDKNKPSYISVANKTFYAEGYSAVNPYYFSFTTDSVFYRFGQSYYDKGVFSQKDEVVIMNLEKEKYSRHAIVVKELLLCDDGIFTLEAPNF